MAADWWSSLKQREHVYECPKDLSGKRLGPLVTYAGKYEPGKYYVGDIYANFAGAERNPRMLFGMASDLKAQDLYRYRHQEPVMCGLPEGGKPFGLMVAHVCQSPYCYPDQEVIEGTRKKILAFSRHDEAIRDRNVILVEDVMNNFSTTEENIELVKAGGGNVIAVCGILNRSSTSVSRIGNIPVHALITKPISQYQQDDPYVADDIRTGNVVLKPKFHWGRLQEAMRNAA